MSIQTAYSEYHVHVTFGDATVTSAGRPRFALPDFGKLFLVYASAAIAGAVIFLVVASLIAYPVQSYSVLSFVLGLFAGAVASLIATSRMIFRVAARFLNQFTAHRYP